MLTRKHEAELLRLMTDEASAVEELRKVEREKAAEKREAAAAIDKRWHGTLTAAQRSRSEAARAVEDFRITHQTHPWLGRKVKGNRYYGGKIGVVQVFRRGDDFPENARFDRPTPGDLVVRALKADGTPGIRIITKLQDGPELPANWELADD